MILPAEKGPQAVQMKKILHHTLALRVRCARVVLVCESGIDESDKRKSDLTIPPPESMCPPCCSLRIQSQAEGKTGLYLPSSYLEYVLNISYPASNTKPMSHTATGTFLTTVLRWCLSRDI